jgi:outer membrane protein TolC
VFTDNVPPIDPLAGTTIVGTTLNRYRLNAAVTKQNPLGGEFQVGVNVTQERFPGSILPLNPETTSNAALSYTQPLLQGFGRPANLAPVVLARINTEISFFQLKNAVQEQVRGTIEAYWNLVAARTTVVARQVQVDQLDFAFRRLTAQARLGLGSGADAAQAHVSLAQFRAQLIAAQSDVLQREAALRNLLGLPPWDEAQLIPTSQPTLERVRPPWQELIELAAARRPDLVELKLILEADEQQRIIANNNALPQLDGVALYRWNGLEGEMPNGNGLSTAPGQFTDWTLGVNFSVPIGLRQSRAALRQRELILARDRANLEQGLHAASHSLATVLRSADQAYEQYLAFKEAREAALVNMARQQAEFEVGRAIFLNVLLAITDLGNAITNEALALTQYNTLLAELELQTGTILETHGVRFYEERYGSIGPLGRLAAPVCYPEATPPTPNYDRYPAAEQAAENVFNLDELRRFRVAPQPEELRLPQTPGELPLPAPPRGPAIR